MRPEQITKPSAFVSMGAVRHNVRVIRDHLALGVKVCAVLKADAYGHGAAAIARELAGAGARRQPLVDAVAVATFDEAEAIGRMSVPVYVLRPIEEVYLGAERGRLEAAIRMGWVVAINSASAARDVAQVARGMGAPALVQVAVDTGMARAGVAVEDFDGVVSAVMGESALRLMAMSTHFVAAEDASCAMTGEQLAQFRRATDGIAAAHPAVVRHVGNSGGVFLHPESHLDMVRPGKAIYGIDPAGGPALGRDLRPVLKWVAPLLMVRKVSRGQSVGYGATFTASEDMLVGVVPVGFADGYARCLSNKGVMLVGGVEAPVVGRVSMDYTTIDVTRVPGVAAGDVVTVIDDEPRSVAGIYSLARMAGTIPSEIFCGIGARIPRIAVGQEAAARAVPPRRAGGM